MMTDAFVSLHGLICIELLELFYHCEGDGECSHDGDDDDNAALTVVLKLECFDWTICVFFVAAIKILSERDFLGNLRAFLLIHVLMTWLS